MRSFSGKLSEINESILSSTKSGRIEYIKDWIENNLYAWQYKLNSDFSIDAVKDIEFHGRTNVPILIKDAGKNTISYDNCGNTTVTLPLHAKTVRFTDCDVLEEININGATEIDSLYFENCPKLSFDNLKNNPDLKVKRLKIVNCGIETLSDITFVSKTIVIEKCKNIDVVNPCKNPMCSVFVTNCPVVSIAPICLSYLSLSELKKSKKIHLDIDNLTELNISDCKNLTDLTINGNKMEQVSIASCEKLENLSIKNDCTISLNLDALPSIKSYDLPATISGSCIVSELLTDPQINCKKRFIKRK